MMRSSIFILLFLTVNSLCIGQALKEQKFNSVITKVAQAFSDQDSIRLSKYINKDLGVYQIHRVGVFDYYKHFETLGFSDKTYPAVLLTNPKDIKVLPLKYASLPTYDCTKERWSKKGLFVDTTKTDHLLSKACIARNKDKSGNIPQQKIKAFTQLEAKSRRVVLYDHNSKEFVFYLSYIDNNWYLTIIDNITSDCSV